MITFHEIRRIIEKMAVLSSHIVQLNQLLPQVIQLSEQIDSLNQDLTLERDRMTAKIRSVEVLGEILKTHVYKSDAGSPKRLTDVDTSVDAQGDAHQATPTSDSTPKSQIGQEGLKNSQGGFYPRLDGSSIVL